MNATTNYPLHLIAWTGGDTPRTADVGDYTERDRECHASPPSARSNILANGRPEILADGYSVGHYALACGAVQATERLGPAGWRVELYREHNVYHVRAFDYAKRDAGAPLDAWRTWRTFPVGELKTARAEAFRMLRAFGWHDIRNRR